MAARSTESALGAGPEPNYIVIKIGGRSAAQLSRLDALCADMANLQTVARPVLVHGGGAEVSELSKKLGLEPQFIDGIRMTTGPEMDVVDMVLAGLMNTRLLRRAAKAGLRAVGLSGVDAGLWRAQSIGAGADGQPNRTGRVVSINPEVVHHLSTGGYAPILSSVAVDADGDGLNINADDAALALAEALHANALIYVSDIPGVLKDGAVISRLTPKRIEAEIATGVIQGGMIPKVRASASALTHGVRRVVIGDYEGEGDLAALIEGHRGTIIEEES